MNPVWKHISLLTGAILLIGSIGGMLIFGFWKIFVSIAFAYELFITGSLVKAFLFVFYTWLSIAAMAILATIGAIVGAVLLGIGEK